MKTYNLNSGDLKALAVHLPTLRKLGIDVESVSSHTLHMVLDHGAHPVSGYQLVQFPQFDDIPLDQTLLIVRKMKGAKTSTDLNQLGLPNIGAIDGSMEFLPFSGRRNGYVVTLDKAPSPSDWINIIDASFLTANFFMWYAVSDQSTAVIYYELMAIKTSNPLDFYNTLISSSAAVSTWEDYVLQTAGGICTYSSITKP